ncbi:PDR/VanB family oxidoreductase [Polymorphum gilvum]|uniref:Oxygenase subunit n=1 Tax=Polymorphum gilvum (strain LMG 25793 / CGMCC 1.9160 / SL003B-26A1) TaxID=991905 RepID=F2J6B0_POLGS|nr:PDR/VanB family oxidoreductase [Polymorphum gilvum]ADZ71284.1 Oxygenase subunit [Polymorphum gilvum SL003B-26A1]
MRNAIEWRQATVASVTEIADGVRLLAFDVEGDLPPFEAGSHTNIKVTINGRPAIRTYTCIPVGHGQLSIAVKLHPKSRGGSRHIFTLEPGMAVEMTVPENRFELSWRASEYLLLAGGIGVTPIYGMARALAGHGARVTMHYGAQNRAAMPFVDELEALLGDRLSLYSADDNQFVDLAAAIERLPRDGELYVCGPLGMLEAVKKAWAEAGRPVSRLRYEVFGDNGKFAEETFEVEILNKNMTVVVPPDKTLLNALMDAGVEMIYDCQRGECGLCAVEIVEADAEVDHRDVFFSEEEKRESHRMCSCVSRLVKGHAVIDIGYRV